MTLTIRGKLLAGFGVVLLLALCSCLFLVWTLTRVDKDYNALIKTKGYAYAWAEAAVGDYNSAAASVRSYVIGGDPADVKKCRERMQNADAHLAAIEPLLQTDEGKRIYKEFSDTSMAFKQYAERVISLVAAREAATGEERLAAERQLAEYLSSQKGIVGKVVDAGNAVAERQRQRLDDGVAQTAAAAKRQMFVANIITAVTIILGLVIALYVARMIAAPISLVDAGAARIAAGDLTGDEIKVRSRDETGRLAASFNTMLVNLREMVKELQEKAQTVSSSAAELSASAQSVSAGASENASTIAEVSSTVETVANNAQQIAQLSTEAAGSARQGNEVLQDVKSQMDAIQEVTAANRNVVHGLSASAGKITQIVELITHIADQTNLLALNAAIEAARAGEHGRGFAVVAEEVRKLAEQSAGAASEIYALINTIEGDAQKAVQSMERSTAQVEAGAKVVGEVETTFQKIITAVQDLADQIQAVASAAEEMSAGVENVAAATEEQTATVEEVSATTQTLARLAGELESLADRFRLGQRSR
ncbi:MAG: methyl-accepting chemotaxis protein [Bacillota bacterium]|nr:methyl-accepting chemotaxis protein [Bacillota bacterium]